MATGREGLRETGRSGPYTSFVRWLETRSETQFAYLLLSPALLLLTLIAVYPLLGTFNMSLHADALAGTARVGEFVGVDNYVQLLTGEKNAILPANFMPGSVTVNGTVPFVHVTDLWTSALTVTLLFTVVSVFFETILGFGQALVLDQDFRGRRWVRVAIIIPWAVPIVIQGMIFFLMFQPSIGFLVGEPNNPAILNQLGLISFAPLVNAQDATWIIIVADIWKTTAFMALLILAGLQSIDQSLYEVARVSGASPWQRFKMITLPLVLPTVLVAMLFRTIAAMRVFGIIETVAGCTTVPSLSCLVISAFNNRLLGTSATVAFVTALIIGITVAYIIVKFEEAGV